MWLPKDERRLLAGYHTLIGTVGAKKTYRLSDLAPLLRFRGHRRQVREYGESEGSTDNCGDLESIKREIVADIDACFQIKKANDLLTERGLITCTPHPHEIDVVFIGLSVAGYDLGRQYSHWLSCTELWFKERRVHCIWSILRLFGKALRFFGKG